MHGLENAKIKVKNVKSFGEEEAGFDSIMPVNLIIGRNNSGKSTLIDIINYVVAPKHVSLVGHQGRNPEIFVTDNLTGEEILQVFKHGTSGGPISGDWWDFGKQWVNRPFTWRVEPDGRHMFVSIEPSISSGTPRAQNIGEINTMIQQLATVKRNPFKSKIFKRIQSDRDIRPEAASNSREVAASGQGATNLIQQFLTKATLPQEQVKQVLLVGLNSIFEPDSSFTEIDIKQHGEGPWEVFLFEPNKGRIPLSQSGSGLKTILLVLVLLHLVPPSENNKLNQYVFGFEELENNLHPALQRRLFLYLRKIALEKECVLFISTQSSVVIDLFSRDEHAQIIHVTHDGEKAKATRAVTYIQNKGILEDLDVRASDLLQSNGIVWVEGPSDRLYFNRWVEVWTDGELREGVHFQCVPYGGKLLAHLSGAEPDLENDLVKILRVNRNAILLLDSDRRQKGARLSATKLRLIKEMEELDGTPWVTYGREIEHYIPIEALKIRYPGNSIQPVGQFDSFADYLDKIKPGEGERFANNKVTFAAEILPYLAKENLNATSDLGSKLEVVCRLIRKWNSSRPPA